MPGIFLSFAGTDREVAREVAAQLRAAGIEVWWDEAGVGWGDDWIGKLQQTLGQCAGYLILIGEQGVRRWVKAELGIALRRHFEEDPPLPIFPLLLHGVTPDRLPPFLGMFQAQRLEALDPATLAECLETVSALPAEASFDPAVCPFPGLEAFEEKDAPFFVGRQSETLSALRMLGPGLDGVYRRWLQVEGPSGVGKSSLVRAGLIPAIRRGWLAQEGERRRDAAWQQVAILRPGKDPVESLAEVLARTFNGAGGAPGIGEVDAALRAGDSRALRHLLRTCSPDGNFLLVADQLEEVFTLTQDSALRARFDALLAAALEDIDGPLHLISTIRSDFMMRFPELPRLQARLNESAGRYFLPPIDAAGLRDVVCTPVRLAGLRWSEATLAERIVEQAVSEPAALPLAAYLLRLLWQRALRRGERELSAADYERLGGVGGALARDADGLLESLGTAGRERARCLLLALVNPGTPSDTRRTITLPQALRAAGGDELAQEVLHRLSGQRDPQQPRDAGSAPRLVVVSADRAEAREGADSRVDLAHEALLREDRQGRPYWATLREWVDKDRDFLRFRQRLEGDRERWQTTGKDLGALLRGAPLAEAEVWLAERGSDLSREEKKFVTASMWQRELEARLKAEQLAEKQRLERDAVRAREYWRRKLIVSVAGVVAVAAIGIAVWQSIVAEQERSLRRAIEPQMVVIGPGSFRMGDLNGSGRASELPVHDVTVPRFAIGRYEVSFAEYDRFAHDTGRRPPSDEKWGGGRRPVINVDWHDARAYARWLSAQSGKRYRLPSEAEWEYAARAGTQTAYWWGNQMEEDRANCLGCRSVGDFRGTEPVGRFDMNPFGLYDTAGNVSEWVQDCWHDSYQNAPADGAAWEHADGDCDQRVLRGGSWANTPERLRSAARSVGTPAFEPAGGIGFRLVRELE